MAERENDGGHAADEQEPVIPSEAETAAPLDLHAAFVAPDRPQNTVIAKGGPLMGAVEILTGIVSDDE